jgi:hypothetical protein
MLLRDAQAAAVPALDRVQPVSGDQIIGIFACCRSGLLSAGERWLLATRDWGRHYDVARAWPALVPGSLTLPSDTLCLREQVKAEAGL